ncbi:Dimethylsulfide methyltransferase corrinoid protein [Methanosarcina siciliae T4/M]|uniref:Dimethylsulfide methyltransferase corrinoid protein n=2 Tax=Methanosarcina siciliae TaxID=38027 RepID=A0A0E3PIB4_9EURY|nr:uroporphyrinogen decarboxylase family protein [Methanosarcina siciliae]AKB30376.1 Dimethylsulfide methyltransferase corrinoid protein [Methanosarcina siciliae T4/M]AKB34294.1 Dimethylsulfide methyltransferase corrinoid protein [Methanosarcina siciliae HI350]
MAKEDILNVLADAVVDGDDELAEEFAQKALDEELDAYEAIVDGLARGMKIISDMYERGEAFVPSLLLAADAMYAGMDILTPYMKVDGTSAPKNVIIGTVEGDVHDIGKNLVKTMMTAAGFNMIDLGCDVPLDKFAETAKEKKAAAISMSTLMTTTMGGMETVIEQLQEEGIRDSLIVMVGGAPISQAFADSVGADGTALDASAAVDTLSSLVSELPSDSWSDSAIATSKMKYKETLAQKSGKEKVDIGRVTAEKIIAEFDSVVPKFNETMTKAERFGAAFKDKKVDRLPVAPLACGVSRKFVPCAYIDYSTKAEKYADCVEAGIKYFNMDTFVGLTDLCVDAADFGATIRYPEEDTPAAIGHLEDYEKLEVPDLNEGTRAYNLIQGNKLATEKAHALDAPMTALIEGPMVALTQIMGATRVLSDLRTNPDVVLKALDKTTAYVEEIMKGMFEDAQPDNLCIVNLWTNNVILSADEYMKSEGQVMQDRIAPLYKKYNKPVVIHNCADAPHWELINKWNTEYYSYTFYPDEAGKGSKDHKYLISTYGKETMFGGEVSPIVFLDNSPEGLQKMKADTIALQESVLNTLKENGMQSKYMISTGCEVPPGAPCDSITAQTYTVAEKGPELYKKIIG